MGNPEILASYRNLLLLVIKQAVEEWNHLHHHPRMRKFKGDEIWGGLTGFTRRDCINELHDFFKEGGLCDFYLDCIRDLGGPSVSGRVIREKLRLEQLTNERTNGTKHRRIRTRGNQ